MEVTITNHPAQARHPVTNKPLVDDEGNPVPLITHLKSVRLDGQLIGYVDAAGNIGFICPKSKFTDQMIDEIRKKVNAMTLNINANDSFPVEVEVEEIDDQ